MQTLKKMVLCLLAVVFLVNGPLWAQTSQPAGEKEQKMFQSAKDAVYKKDWLVATEQWRNFCTQFPQSQWGAEPYYWLSYALNQAAREISDFNKQTAMFEQAMIKVEMLLERFKDSTWASDARMLRIELAEKLVKAGKAQYKKYITRGAEAENGADINVKLVALDALLQMDEEKALPILKKIIRENKDKNIRAKAVFVLSQHDDPSIAPLLGEIARKDTDPYVREQAIFWLGQHGDGLGILLGLYHDSMDKKLKEKILFAFSEDESEASFNKLLEIAKGDSDLEMREKALFWIGQSDNERAPGALMDMYKANTDIELKKKIIFSLGQLEDEKSSAFLKEIATGNSEDRLKEEAVFWIGQKGGEANANLLKAMYDGNGSFAVKEKILFSLSQNESQAALKHLFAIARSEKNPELKKKAIFWIGQFDSDEAAKFLQQLIDQD
jgi:HEAT repeat protein